MTRFTICLVIDKIDIIRKIWLEKKITKNKNYISFTIFSTSFILNEISSNLKFISPFNFR